VANPHRGEASFEVDGKTYRLRYDWNAAAEFEDAAGRPLSDALLDVAREKLSAKSLRAMLWAGLQQEHPEATLKDVGRLIDRTGRREAQRLMGSALRYFFPELEEATGSNPEGNPPPAAAPSPTHSKG
jgi:hypothetical protein